MPFDPIAIANTIIELGHRNRVPISPMKLQKLVYISHGWHLALTDEPLLAEPVRAWKFGPVIPSVYHAFKRYGADSIESAGTGWDSERGFTTPNLSASGDPKERDARLIIERVFQLYKDVDAIELSRITHQPGTPWHQVAGSSAEVPLQPDLVIPDDSIKQHYMEIMRRHQGKRA